MDIIGIARIKKIRRVRTTWILDLENAPRIPVEIPGPLVRKFRSGDWVRFHIILPLRRRQAKVWTIEHASQRKKAILKFRIYGIVAAVSKGKGIIVWDFSGIYVGDRSRSTRQARRLFEKWHVFTRPRAKPGTQVVVRGRLEIHHVRPRFRFRRCRARVPAHGISADLLRELDRFSAALSQPLPHAAGRTHVGRIDRRRRSYYRILRRWIAGQGIDRIARVSGRSRSTVSRIISAFRKKGVGALYPDRRRTYRPLRLSVPVLNWLRYLLSHSPRYFGIREWDRWTVRRIVQYVKSHNLVLSPPTVLSGLRQIGARFDGEKWTIVRFRHRTKECSCGKRFPAVLGEVCPECFAISWLAGRKEQRKTVRTSLRWIRIRTPTDLQIGERIRHPVHGEGTYAGIRTISIGGREQHYVVMDQGPDLGQVLIPIARLDLLRKLTSNTGISSRRQ